MPLKSLQVDIVEFLPKINLESIKSEVQEKIKEDLIRFRTCCADPRASK